MTRTRGTVNPDIDPLLALDDNALEDVMAAVYLWCSENSVSIGSQEGQEAIRLAALYRDQSEVTPERIVKFLASQLQP